MARGSRLFWLAVLPVLFAGCDGDASEPDAPGADAPRFDTPRADAPGADAPMAAVDVPAATDTGDGPASVSVARLRDLQGDLMLWVPALTPTYVDGVEPVTGIREIDDRGAHARGIENGWVWTVWVGLYPPASRELIYRAALELGYTHFAVHVAACRPETGYHGLRPVTAEECVGAGERMNGILRELWDHGLIPICAGVSPTDPVEPGLDLSLCRVALTDWDNSDEADCRIRAIAETFPDAQLIYELPSGASVPRPDACSPVPFPATGAEWVAAAQARHPNFFAVAYEPNQPEGLDANTAMIDAAHAWFGTLQEIRFEVDTYWKFWENLPFAEAQRYNDDLQLRVPYLRGFMSGGTSHAPPP